MPYDIGAFVSVKGESQYTKAMKSLKTEMAAVSAEAKAATAAYGGNDKSIVSLTRRSSDLKRAQEVQKKAVQEAQKALVKMRAEGVDPASDAYRQMTANLYNAEAALSKTNTEIKENAKSMASLFGNGIANGAKALATGIAAIGTAAVAGGAAIVKLTKDAAENADALITLSAQTSVSKGTLQEWDYAARFIDTDVSTMRSGLKKVTSEMGKANKAEKDYITVTEGLDVAIRNSDGTLRSAEDTFYDVIDALGTITDETERDIAAQDIFGKSFDEMKPLIDAGSKGLKDYAKEARDAGIILSDEMVEKLGAADDAFERIDAKVDALKGTLAADFAPAVEEALGGVFDLLSGNVSIEGFLEGLSSQVEAIDTKTTVNAAESFISKITEGIKAAPSLIKAGTELILGICDGLSGNAKENGSELGQAVGDCIQACADAFDQLAGPVSELAFKFSTAFAMSVGEHLPEILFSVIKGVFSGGGGAIDGMLEGIGADTKIGFDNAGVQAAYEEAGLTVGEVYGTNVGEGIKSSTDSAVKPAVEKATSAIEDPIEDTVSQGEGWGEDMVNGMADGMNAAAPNLQGAVNNLVDIIYSNLHFSRPDAGPLRYYEQWMPDFMGGLAAGIRDNAYKVEDAIGGLTGGMAAGLSVSGGGATVVNLTVTDPSPAYMDYLFEKFNVRMAGVV